MQSCIFVGWVAVCISLVGVYAQDEEEFSPADLVVVPDSGVQLWANITSLESSPAWVEVSWSGVTEATIADAVAFMVPANASFNVTPPAKFFWASTNNPGYMSTGSGTARFHVLNHRQDFKFIFVRNVSSWQGNFTQLAETPVIPLANPNQPTQIHLYLTGTEGEMGVQWTTRDPSDAATVRYGTSAGQYTMEASNATTDTYTTEDMCGGQAAGIGWFFPGIFHNVILSDLEPDTRYFYSVGSEVGGFSQEWSFLTAPVTGPNGTVRVLALADLGYCEKDGAIEWTDGDDYAITPSGTDDFFEYEVYDVLDEDLEPCASLNTAAMMAADLADVTLVVHNGDLSYAEGWVYGWDVYMDMLAPILAQAPYMMVNGNHEQDWPETNTRYPDAEDSGGECGVVTAKRFPMPGAINWYSFNHGPVHFLQMDTEIDYSAGSEQFNFMLADLKNVDRSITPWLVAGYHRPMYADAIDGNELGGHVGDQNDERAAWELLFFQYQVDMSWYGHVHDYVRTCPVLQSNCLPDNADGSAAAPVHMLIGNSGQAMYYDHEPITPTYYVTDATQHGYLRMEASATTADVAMVNSLNGRYVDKFTLTKPAGWAANETAQLDYIGTFVGSYKPSVWELHGINGAAQDLVLWAAVDLLQSEPEFLDLISNTRYARNLNIPDSTEATAQYFQAVIDVYNSRIAGTADETPATKYFWENYFKPVYELYISHPDGMLKGAELGPAMPAVPQVVVSDAVAG